MNSANSVWGLSRLFILLLFIAALVEVVIRVAVFPEWRAVGQVPYTKHQIYGTFQKPHLRIRRINPPNYDVVNTTNALGFRDREGGFEEDLNGIWIAGASNTYGGFVADDKIYTSRLQGLGYKVANLSSEGHRLADQVKVMKHLFSQGYRPKLVIAEVTLNNAFGNHAKALAELSLPLSTVVTEETKDRIGRSAKDALVGKVLDLKSKLEFSWIGFKGRLVKNSATYAWLKVGINSIPSLRALTLSSGLRADVAMADSTPIELQRKADTTEQDGVVVSTADYIAALQAWVGKNLHAPFGLIIIPSSHHLNPTYFERYARHHGVQTSDYDRTRSYQLFTKLLRQRGVNVLGLAPVLEAADTFTSFPDDGHLNASGHEIVSRTLAQWLSAKFGMAP